MINQSLINHVVLVVDRSDSMFALRQKVVEVFDQQVQDLARLSKENNQETRVSVYLFSNPGDIDCVVYDQDVLRLPSFKSHYWVFGMTALLDASALAITELKQTAVLHGDHAFLVYVLTDGEENRSKETTISAHHKLLGDLPDNWTVAALVPNTKGVELAQRFGFPTGNIMIWETTGQGLEAVSSKMTQATTSYMRARATGVRGTSTLFDIDTSALTKGVVASELPRLPCSIIATGNVQPKTWIRDFVEDKTGQPFRPGTAFYKIIKTEILRPGRDVAIVDKVTGIAYGGANARRLIGLPPAGSHGEKRIHPDAHPTFDVYIQSASLNRYVDANSALLLV